MSASSHLSKKVLDFWFKHRLQQHPNPVDIKQSMKLWFSSSNETDALISTTFKEELTRLAANENSQFQMMQSEESALAMVIMFDQFSRNIFRNTSQMFAYDDLGLKYALMAIDRGYDRSGKIDPIQISFFYLPLEHAENMDIQKKCVEKFEQLLLANANNSSNSNSLTIDYLKSTLEYAKSHAQIIEKFGRFPHRNAILGRVNTKEEEMYLKGLGSSLFGVDIDNNNNKQ